MRDPALIRALRRGGYRTLLALSMISLAACGGGGGSGSSSSTSSGGGTSTSSFTIGGTITGLDASGLVLTDNGGDNLTVASGSSSFTFTTQLASGSTYDVAVATQPTGETCTVSNATGTDTANVTSVGVSCAATTYTVAGTITGLTNAGLKLQDYSSGETLSVSAGAKSYQFTQPVPYGTNVKVTVVAQPSLQTCTAGASNFSGPIDANITTDTFSCMTLTATVSTFAGATASGNVNGTGTAARFDGPIGVAVDSLGNVYVADSTNNEIRLITPAGVVTTLAGTGTAGYVDNTTGNHAEFSYPTGVAVDSSGTIYVADFYNNRIRKIVCTSLTASACTVSTLAGQTTAGSADGTGAAAQFNEPSGVSVDSLGNVYVADYGNNEIRKVTSAGIVTTLAGSTSAGHADGSGTVATFSGPAGVAVDSSGNVYVADFHNNEIRLINASDVVSTLAGSLTAGHSDGQGSSASFDGPNDVAVDAAGNVYVADSLNNEIRLVAPSGLVSTLAGTGAQGAQNGPATSATFSSPSGLAVVTSGSASGDVFVGDLSNNEIREIVP